MTTNGRLDRATLERLIEAVSGDDGSPNGSGGGGSTALDLIQLRRANDDLQSQIDSLKNSVQMSALMPMLMGNKLKLTADVPVTASKIVAGTEFDFDQADPTAALLPMLMMGGGFGGGGSDGQNNMMMALILSNALKP